jgi:hypothetical protein
LNSLKYLLIDVAPHLRDSDPTGATLLSTDLSIALASLDGKDAASRSATWLTKQRHARHAYDEAAELLPQLSADFTRRSHLEAQLGQLRSRLKQLGEDI